jgi:hypothetical protein
MFPSWLLLSVTIMSDINLLPVSVFPPLPVHIVVRLPSVFCNDETPIQYSNLVRSCAYSPAPPAPSIPVLAHSTVILYPCVLGKLLLTNFALIFKSIPPRRLCHFIELCLSCCFLGDLVRLCFLELIPKLISK